MNMHWVNNQLKDTFGPKTYYGVTAFFQTFGILLALIRLFEPYVWQTFRTEVLKLCGRKYRAKKLKYSAESLDSFLNSAMNIEFVYIILLGIKGSICTELSS